MAKTITSAVRAIMKNAGKNQLFTNTYKNCRTVKVYGTITAATRERITELGRTVGKNITVETKVGLNYMRSYVTIVRVPGSSTRDNIMPQ